MNYSIMNKCYFELQNFNDKNWIDFYILLGELSKSIRKNNFEQIKDNIICSIHDILCFAKQNDIDMNASWHRWQKKMDYKNYN